VPPGPGTPPTPSGSPAATATASATAIATGEVPPTGAATPGTATPPGSRPATPTASATATGPAEQRQVCLIAFDDVDGDGLRGPAERFLPNVTVRLAHLASGAFVTWTTDGQNDPDYCWSGLTDGAYAIETVQLPLGYVAGGPASYRFDVPFPGEPAVFGFALRKPATPTPTAPPSAGATSTAIGPTPPRNGTATPAVTLTPSITPSPTEQPTVTGPSGEICVAAFVDADRSGDRQPGEAFLRDVLVTVRDVERREVRGLRTVERGAVCSRLPAGVYYVAVAPGAVLPLTTPREVAVLLTAQQRHIVEFGLGASRPATDIFIPVAAR
jgi:hypothetical protein